MREDRIIHEEVERIPIRETTGIDFLEKICTFGMAPSTGSITGYEEHVTQLHESGEVTNIDRSISIID